MLSPYRNLPPRKEATLHLGRRRCGKDVPPLLQPSVAPTGARHRSASISRNQRLCDESTGALLTPFCYLLLSAQWPSESTPENIYLMKTAIRFPFTARELEIQQVIGCRLRRLL